MYNKSVFNRIEKKYLLDENAYHQICVRLDAYMEQDHYGLHNIRNIYYDTETNELIRTSIEKPVYKEKLRLRCYGQPTEDSDVFLEIKKKYRGVVNKRRAALTYREMTEYLKTGVRPEQNGQIWREIDFLRKRYELRPRLYLSYDRIALFAKEDAEFRITFDKNIRSRRENLTLLEDGGTKPLLDEGVYLMEVKVLDAMPLWFAGILSELKISSVSFSKYGSIYQRQVAEGIWQYEAGFGYENSKKKHNGGNTKEHTCVLPEGFVV